MSNGSVELDPSAQLRGDDDRTKGDIFKNVEAIRTTGQLAVESVEDSVEENLDIHPLIEEGMGYN